jgi:hypothetical protein
MQKNKSILVISFYTNLPGSCQAEWVDDRMNALIDKGYNITLISSRGAFKHKKESIRHIRIPCVNPHGANSEFKEIKSRNIKINQALNLYYRAMEFIDIIVKKVGISTGEGRWNWGISGLSSLFYQHKKYSFIYTTGGPASAHLLGILYAKLLGSKLLLELQDPLTGKDIGRNKFSKLGLWLFEKYFVKKADFTVYCTKNASEFSKKNYPKYAQKIHHIYPGSYFKNSEERKSHKGRKIRITYLGSLYATRNLTKLMKGIEILNDEDPNYLSKFEIHLYGNIEEKILTQINKFRHKVFIVKGLVPREKALKESLNSDVLLLIQNTDDRSINTIPFKTYDYLRTGRLIFGLTYKNKEIDSILTSHNHLVSNANDAVDISLNLKRIILNINDLKSGISVSVLTPQKAVEEMLKLVSNH